MWKHIFTRYLDFINVKTFDFHTYKDGIARHHSALYSAINDEKDIKSNTVSRLSTLIWAQPSSKYLVVCVFSSFLQDFALQYWRSQGAPTKKLLMGFSTYGRSFILNSSQTGVGASANKFASPGPHTQEIGLWAYYEVNVIKLFSGLKVLAPLYISCLWLLCTYVQCIVLIVFILCSKTLSLLLRWERFGN